MSFRSINSLGIFREDEARDKDPNCDRCYGRSIGGSGRDWCSGRRSAHQLVPRQRVQQAERVDAHSRVRVRDEPHAHVPADLGAPVPKWTET